MIVQFIRYPYPIALLLDNEVNEAIEFHALGKTPNKWA